MAFYYLETVQALPPKPQSSLESTFLSSKLTDCVHHQPSRGQSWRGRRPGDLSRENTQRERAESGF